MTALSQSDSFYAGLEPFREFDEISDFAAYRPFPDDWVAMAGDIAGSTKAIAEGRYKAVNMVGAAVITAVLNVCRGHDLPYVFGGDGGLVMVPGHLAPDASAALQRLQVHSVEAFDLTLRAAAVPVSRLRAEGHDLLVRKLLLNGRNHLAMFAGTGVARTDEILKSGDRDDPHLLRETADPGPPDLEGLSCRWEPLAASRSKMIALMVQPVEGQPARDVLQDVLRQLNAVLDGSITAHAPAGDQTLRFRWPPTGLGLERRLLAFTRGPFKAWCWTHFTALAQKLCHGFGIKIGDYDGPAYLDEIKLQTDFRKYDGCFRTVLDCSEAEIAAIRANLERERGAGRLVYGIHVDRSALMTCLIFSLGDSEHIHFIDAAGGGFARAAEEMKAQIAGA